ncbi:MAG TPA: hypothetical protein VLT16_14965, partial [Candidatus Limnocylindrales bacterium]|nr:hypothetical protein [Candidatus Limnocylindrales bacterium]
TGVLIARWSPDGSKIAFHSSRALDGTDAAGPASNVWIVNPDGSGAVPVTRLTVAGATFPAWSPDGKKLAFESARALDGSDAGNVNLTNNLWTMNADGSSPAPLTRYTATGPMEIPFAWSPDGRRIAFSSLAALDGSDATNTNRAINLWVMNADGAGLTPLTRLTAAACFLDGWSLDGTSLLFDSARALDGSDAVNKNTTVNIWSTNADGTGVRPITMLQNANSVEAAVKP